MEREGYSTDQFLASAATEKMASLRTLVCLRNEGAGSGHKDFENYLAAVPDGEPIDTDRLPE